MFTDARLQQLREANSANSEKISKLNEKHQGEVRALLVEPLSSGTARSGHCSRRSRS